MRSFVKTTAPCEEQRWKTEWYDSISMCTANQEEFLSQENVLRVGGKSVALLQFSQRCKALEFYATHCGANSWYTVEMNLLLQEVEQERM